MLVVVIIIWVLVALVFFLALAYVCSRPGPKMEEDQEISPPVGEGSGKAAEEAERASGVLTSKRADSPAGQDNGAPVP
jgi:hypothetical protein